MAYLKKDRNLTIRNAEIMFKNFSGRRKESKGKVVNEEGNRNFCLVIPDQELANQLMEDGWNVRILAPREEGDEAKYYISVAVNYGYYIPPEIHVRTKKTDTIMTEETVGTLDFADIKEIGVTVRPRIWENQSGETRVKAYLKSMIVILEEDELLEMYAMEEAPDEIPFE